MKSNDFETIAQASLAIMNPTSAQKLLEIGREAGLDPDCRVIEFGCGNGTLLVLWAQKFGILGTGIEISEDSCVLARETIREAGLEDRIRIIRGDASQYHPGAAIFDIAVALGSSHIWGGPGPALDALHEAVRGQGMILIGERYWKSERVPPEFSREWQEIPTEYELLQMIRMAGYDLAAVVRANEDDWAAYETAIWRRCRQWAEEHPGDEKGEEMLAYLRRLQDEYLGWGREYVGWAMYLLVPHAEGRK